jgi:hypothetical protein
MLRRHERAAVEIFRRLEFLRARIFPARVIRAADGPTLQRIPRFIVGAARETAAQTRFASPNKARKAVPFGAVRADCSGAP